jgi:hypothetical protein
MVVVSTASLVADCPIIPWLVLCGAIGGGHARRFWIARSHLVSNCSVGGLSTLPVLRPTCCVVEGVWEGMDNT